MGRPCSCGPCRAGCGPCYGPDDYDSLPSSLTVTLTGGDCNGNGNPLPCTPAPWTIVKQGINPSGPPCNMRYIRWVASPPITFNCGALGDLTVHIGVHYLCRSSDGYRALELAGENRIASALTAPPLVPSVNFVECDARIYRPRAVPFLLNAEFELWTVASGSTPPTAYRGHLQFTE